MTFLPGSVTLCLVLISIAKMVTFSVPLDVPYVVCLYYIVLYLWPVAKPIAPRGQMKLKVKVN